MLISSGIARREQEFYEVACQIESEIRKRRPCVIIGATPVNIARRTIVIVPLSTATQQGNPPVTVVVRCLDRQVIAVCDQIRAVDKTRLVEFIGRLRPEDMESISAALKQILVR